MTAPVEFGLLTLSSGDPAAFVERAKRAEADGYDILWVADERFFRDCWVSLGHLAAHTTRIRLGVCVSDPYSRHPALTAAAVGTLDVLSAGRAILGLGAGVSGLTAMEIDRVKPITAMREALHVIRGLLAGERVDLAGEVVRFTDGALDFVARPDIPVMIATNGPKMLELAGELADAVMVQGMASPAMVEAVRERVAAGARRAGRDPDAVRLIARLDVCLSEYDPAAARARMRPGLVRHLITHHPRYESFRLAGVEVPAALSDAVAGLRYGHAADPELQAVVPDEWIDRFCLAGDPDRVTDQIRTLQACGVGGVTVMPVDLDGNRPVTAEMFASAVLPQVRSGKEAT